MADIDITVDSSQVKIAQQELKELANRSISALRASKQLSGQSNLDSYFASVDRQISRVNGNMSNYSRFTSQAANSSGQFGVVTQQAGYQIGDFLVQVQSGTNWMVAFGQQATQLVGVLPLMGAGFMGLSTGGLVALSAGLGIAIPLITALGAVFMRMREEADSASSSVLSLADAQEQLNKSTEDYAIKLEMLRFGVDTQAEAVALKEIYNVTAQIQSLTKQYQQTDSLSRRQSLAEEIQSLKGQLSVQQDIVDTANEKRNAYEKAQAIGAQMAAVELGQARAIGQAEKDRVAAGEAIYKGLIAVQSANQSIIRSNNQISETVQTAIGHYANMRTVAAGVANEMTRAASASFALAQQNLAAGGLVYSGRGGNPATVNQQGGAFVYEGPALDANNMPIVSGGGGGGSEPTESMLEKLQKQLDLEKELLNTTEVYQRVRSDLGDEFVNTSPKIIEGLMQQATEIENLTRLEEERQSLMDSVNGSLESGFMDMIKGTKTVGEAFRSMAASILEELVRVLVVQKMVGAITSAFGGGSFTNVAGLTGGGRASGGSMMAGNSYLVGENGPELVVPRHSGTVLNANQTANAAGGNGGLTVQNNINVTGSDAATVRAEVVRMLPQITNVTKAAVIEARQRGGSYKTTFG